MPKRAIILTAHMGNYELGAGLFIEKFKRKIRMARAPEPDDLSAQHLNLSLERSSGGAVKVDYSTEGTTRLLKLRVLGIDPIEIPTQKRITKKHPG